MKKIKFYFVPNLGLVVISNFVQTEGLDENCLLSTEVFKKNGWLPFLNILAFDLDKYEK